jgi:hypothetical protein
MRHSAPYHASALRLASACLLPLVALAADNEIRLGEVAVTLDASWTIFAHKAEGPVWAIATQIRNHADAGTKDSTNLAITIFDMGDAQATASLTKILLGITDAKEGAHGRWRIMDWNGEVDGTRYAIHDSVLRLEERKLTLLVRLAYPQLAENPPDYAARLVQAAFQVIDGITIGRP